MTDAVNGAQTTWRKVSRAELEKALQAHALFRSGRVGGRRIDFNHCDLSGHDLSGRDLTDANLTATKLQHARLVGTVLRGAILFACDLRLIAAKGVDLSK